jgi:signal transduction histidine kinase/CheY-like chemotaxis protein
MDIDVDAMESLRRGLRESVALSALSAVWSRSDLPAIAGSLGDVLLRSLEVDLVYVRLPGPSEESPYEAVRTPAPAAACTAAEVGRLLGPLFETGGSPPATIASPVDDGMLRVVVLPIGISECGFLVAGSRQPGFPSQMDRLLLSIGANQAAVVVEHKRAEEALREADRRKDEFLATLAHELRNPLAPLRNSLEILRHAEAGGALLERARGMMERQVQQLVRLVDDLLDLSRVTRNKLELRRERIDLAAVVQSAVETSGPLLQASGQRLTLDLPPRPILLDADPTRLAQVFSNLLNNAAKYGEPGGSISLTGERHGASVVVSVRDTGIGIPAPMLPRIFDMFTQVDSSLERAHGGLGIGLTLVRSLVELHGGTVEARSAGPGQGSEFTIRLPAVAIEPDDAPREAPSRPEPAEAPPRRRILVVDDNEDAATSLSLLLTLAGNEVRTGHDGLAAVEMAAAFRPTVILLDIGMPRLNGYEAARRIREQQGEEVVLIALTGWGQDEDRRQAQEAGFDHHLVKPLDFAILQGLLAAVKTSTP